MKSANALAQDEENANLQLFLPLSEALLYAMQVVFESRQINLAHSQTKLCRSFYDFKHIYAFAMIVNGSCVNDKSRIVHQNTFKAALVYGVLDDTVLDFPKDGQLE